MRLHQSLVLICVVFGGNLFAQVVTNYNNKIPINEQGWYNKDYLTNTIHIPEPDTSIIAVYEKEDQEFDGARPFRFAYALSVDLNVVDLATWVYNGSYAYGMFKAEVLNSKSLSVNFNNFFLPEGTEVFIYNESGDMITGPVTANQNNDLRIWGSVVYKGDILIIEIKTPANKKNELVLNISNIAYGYKEIFVIESVGYGGSSSCNINVLCPLGSGWENERQSVALILNENGTRWCSGSLINNACNLDKQYFLTANHCLYNGEENVSMWRFIFDYWSPVCSPTQDGDTSLMFYGAELKANNSNSDFALVEIVEDIPSNSNYYYSGWSRALTNTLTILIHHPAGDVMKISRDNDSPVFDYIDPSDPEWVEGAYCWKVILDSGATDGGSSGCPYYNQDHRIIGQHFASAPGPSCEVNTKYGGRFDLSWTGDGSNSTRLSNWLDPNNLGLMTIDGRSASEVGGTSDLRVISQSINPTSITAGEIVEVSFIEENIGSTNAGPNYVSFHLSANNILTPGLNGDIYLDEYFVSQSLGPNGQTMILSKDILIPSSVTTGTYYLFFSADGSQLINECDEDNNFATAILNVTGVVQLADLIVQNASVSPNSIAPGGQATAYCKNKNQGNANAGSSYTAIWLSQNQVFNGAPTDINLNADILFPPLNAGQISSLLSHQITIPSGTACGTWYIMFGADALNQVSEGNETNNQVFVPITVSCPLMCNNDFSCGPPEPPFLTIYNACVPTSCSTVGAHPPSPDILFTCGNQYQSGRYDDDVWFRITPSNTDEITITVEPTSNLDDFDPVIGLYSGYCLTPTQNGCADAYAEGVTENLVFTPVAGTTYLIRVFGYGIGSAYSGNFDICVVTEGQPDPADIVITNPTFTDYTICAGESTTVSYTISNIGGTDAPASIVKYYLSTNSTYSASDDLLGSTSVGSLDVNESNAKTKTLDIPADTDEDTWYILIIADANDSVDEGTNGEGNNLYAVSIQVIDCGGGVADLIIDYDYHTPAVITPGTLLHVYFVAENIGNEVAPTNDIGIYISDDNNFDPGSDEYLDEWFQNSLDPGEIDVDDLNFEVPDCYQCGAFYIFLVIDYQHVIIESNNNNNDDYFQIEVTGCTACSYSVPASGISFQSSGGSGNFAVTTTECCPWTATTNDDWITITSSSGVGSSFITYSVDPCSDGTTRVGIITVEGQEHEISQDCTESCNASQMFEWATRAGSATLSDAAEDLAIDAAGNLYMTGDIQGSADFGNGIILITPSNAPDIFVSKHNASGVIQWAVRYGNIDQDKGSAIETDTDGNIYVTGYFENTVMFGSFTLTSNDEDEYAAFILKLNSSGTLQWAHKINSVFTGIANDMAIDQYNNIFIVGDLSDYSEGIDNGLFMAKYNSSGNQLFYNTYAFSSRLKNANGVVIDNLGNIFMCGRFMTTINLNGIILTSTGLLNIDGYIVKLDDSGNVIWARKVSSIDSQGQDWLFSIAVDTSNSIYTVGHVDSTAVVGDITIPLSDGTKLIVIKYDQNGNPIWAKASVVGFQANKKRMIKGMDNDIYFSGSFSDSIQIDSFLVVSNGGPDAFIGRIDANAKIKWIRGFGGSQSDDASGLAMDSSNNIYIAGGFTSTVVFDNIVLTSAGSTDIYISKYVQCDPPAVTIMYSGDPVICSGETVTLSTDYCSTNSYQWKFNGNDIPGANNPTYVATEPGLYTVNVSALEDCETLSDPVEIASQGFYTFIGNGNWEVASNWSNNAIPPPVLQSCYEIIIDHVAGGQCILNASQTFAPMGNVTVRPGKTFIILPD